MAKVNIHPFSINQVALKSLHTSIFYGGAKEWHTPMMG
jgi:hypothetical protein